MTSGVNGEDGLGGLGLDSTGSGQSSDDNDEATEIHLENWLVGICLDGTGRYLASCRCRWYNENVVAVAFVNASSKRSRGEVFQKISALTSLMSETSVV